LDESVASKFDVEEPTQDFENFVKVQVAAVTLVAVVTLVAGAIGCYFLH